MPNWFLALDPVSSWLLLLGGACSAGLGVGALVGALRGIFGEHLPRWLGRRGLQLSDARREYEASEIERAFAVLSAVRRRDPDDEESALLMWEIGRDAGHPDEAENALLHVIRRELERGDDLCAATHWVALRKSVEVTAAEPSLLLRIAPALERAGQTALCLEALRSALPSAASSGCGAIAARVARCARRLDRALAEEALWVALSDPQLDPALRNTLERERAEIYAADAAADAQRPALDTEPEPSAEAAAASAPEAPACERTAAPEAAIAATEWELTPTADLPELAPMPGSEARACAPEIRLAQVVDAEPLRLERDSLVVLVGAQRCRVHFDRIDAIAAGAVAGLAPRRVLVVDLLLRGSAGDRGPRVVRLRSDRFRAAQKLQPERSSAHALRWLAESVFARSRARALPDRESLRGRPYRRFDSLAQYTRAVLGCEHDASFVPALARRTIAVGAPTHA
jgi:hypothetical protein